MVGHDAAGRMLLVVVEGSERDHKGLTIYGMADLAIYLGMVNAVNLDGKSTSRVPSQAGWVARGGCSPFPGAPGGSAAGEAAHAGGGSSTVVYQGRVLNKLTDQCVVDGKTTVCERLVTTVFCVR